MHIKTGIKYFIIVLSFFIISIDTNANNIDSLKASLLHTETFEKRLPILFDLATEYSVINPDSGLIYFQKIISKSNNLLKEQSNNKQQKIIQDYRIKSLIQSGTILRKQAKYSQALDYFEQASSAVAKTKNNVYEGEIYQGMGIVLRQQGNYKNALEYELKALDIAKTEKDSSWIASLYNNLGVVYMGLNNYKDALHVFTNALEIVEKTKVYKPNVELLNIGNIYKLQKDYPNALKYVSKSLEISKSTGEKQRIAECYYIIGDIYLDQKKSKLARKYFLDALNIFNTLNFNYGSDECFSKIGESYKNENKLSEALSYYKKALKLSKEQNDKETESLVLYEIADLYYKMKNIPKAINYANRSFDISIKMNFLYNLNSTYKLLSECYEQQGDFKRSLFYFKKHSEIRDSIFSEEKYKAVLETEARYQNLKKDMELSLLQKEKDIFREKAEKNRIMNVTTGIISLLLLLLMLLGYFYYRQREKAIKIKAEKEKTRIKLEYDKKTMKLRLITLKSQLNPHFIFNTLNSIGSVILKEDKQNTYDLFTNFTSLIRHTIENSDNISIELKEELDQIEKYLFLQKFRFKGVFDYKINIGDDVDLSIPVPRMCVEIFVENAIKHGLKTKEKEGLITINIDKNDNEIIIEIIDNGIGREKASQMNNFGTGRGINIANEMFSLYENIHKNKVKFEIIDLYDYDGNAVGTKVIEHIFISK